MVGILLKIGKQPENVGEEEVFGRFCIRDVTGNPSGELLRRPDIRPPEIGFCPMDGPFAAHAQNSTASQLLTFCALLPSFRLSMWHD